MKLFHTLLTMAAVLLTALCLLLSFTVRADDDPQSEDPTVDRILIFSFKNTTTDMILIESNGHYGLVDASNASSADLFPTEASADLYNATDNGKNQGEFIRDVLGVEHLDFILATHAHSDHIGGITEIAELGLIDNDTVLIYKEYKSVNEQEDYDWHNIELVEMARKAFENNGGKIVMIRTDSPETTDYSLLPGGGVFHAGGSGNYDDHVSFEFGDFNIDLFNLDSRSYTGYENANSILTLLTIEGRHILLMGDMNNADYIGADMAAVISDHIGGERIDLLKDGHHGTVYGSNTEREAELYMPAIDITSRKWSGDLLYGNIANFKYYCEKNYGTAFYAAGDSERAVAADISDGTIRIENMLDDGSYSSDGMPLNCRIPALGWLWWDSGKGYVKTGNIDWFFYNDEGERAEGVPGWGNRSIDWFYLTPSESDNTKGIISTGLIKIDDCLYYFGSDGVMLTGWIEIDGVQYYFSPNGAMANGWTQIDDDWYYFGSDGFFTTGLSEIDGKKYYFNDEGIMETGWITIDGQRYFFDSSGAMTVGWVSDNGNWYYLNEDSSIATGWQNIDDKWYYLQDDGVMTTGWLNDGGKWYYFAGSGSMVTDWRQVDGRWYYFNPGGSMVTGWRQVDGRWYYFNPGGSMATGWRQISGKWYYFNPGGSMATGWLKYMDKWYYLKPSGKMAASEWVPEYYWIGADGVWSYKYKGSWHKDANGWWFGDASGWYARNTTITIDGKGYRFNASGYWVK